ncbi:hypothetical protein DEIPH_ctg011orf0005 [Deinococcus phoenicis]|uniref:Uncharacterized protein n=1 Tax=Deinococcus phoenicis TaxID=1476583 RepID=A0A016QT67_9DEIO|nr:hypothetical protein [Deinococcus phoenicis]EYB69042.1 hypothetical protein DEIPH_ctg011orf0005 [Deinococcus phoenicis]
MSFEAHDAPPFGTPDETFSAAAITVQLSYGPLGTLRSGNIGLSSVPSAWEGRAWPRMIRVRLESELGTGFIAAGIAEAAIVQRGELSGIPLVGLETTYLGRPGDSSAALNGAGLTPGGAKAYGVTMPAPDSSKTRQQAVDDALEPYPNSEAGVTADLTGVIGRPESATPGVYTLDSRAYGLRSLGWTVTDYLTDATYQAGPDFPVRTYSRPDVPPFAPRRFATITPDPMTETVDELATGNISNSGVGQAYQMTGAGNTTLWVMDAQAYRAAGQRPVDLGIVRKLILRLQYEVAINSPYPITLTVRMNRGGLQPAVLGAMSIRLSGVFTQDFEVPAELWGYAAILANTALTDVYITVSGDVPSSGPESDRNTFKLISARSVITREYERARTLTMPRGWNMPYAVGPTYEFNLPGVHVPPFRVDGLPGGVSQYAAGAVVTWNRSEASTRILTAALPYRGQTRGRT